MKKIMTIIFVLILSILSLCGCMESNSKSNDYSLFVGTWTSEHENAPFVFGDKVTFNEDETLTYSSSGICGSYKIKGNTIEFFREDGSKGSSKSFSFSENNTVLTLKDSSWDKTAVYEKKGATGGNTATTEKQFEEIHIGNNGNNGLEDILNE